MSKRDDNNSNKKSRWTDENLIIMRWQVEIIITIYNLEIHFL